ncbi:MAG TPA: peptide MFS transporter [Xanthobacteraceae bacterium]|nr:peptide MFS transporter [Xanthobacteraceae bacterium]
MTKVTRRENLVDRIESMPLSAAPAEIFGHPRGLTFLFTTEMWERFSYYGMRSLLVLYMTKYLLLPEHSGDVRGLLTVKSALEGIFGPLDVQPLSSQIWGFYTALVYFTPIFGGLLADRVLGQRRTVVIGAILMAIGHFMMAFEPLFLFALLSLILGNGAFKPNISTQVGGLYAPGDHRRDRAYSIFYVGINIGAFLAPLICGTLGEKVGWHYGFATAGVGMCIGLAIYLYAQSLLPPDELHKARAAHVERKPLDRDEWRAVVALLVLFVPNTLFWATYDQMGNTTVLWADANTDRTLSLFGLSGQIPTTWFLAFNPFLIFAFTPFVVALWARQAARGTEPSTISKMALGCFGVTVANLIMLLIALYADGGKASWVWLLGYYVTITLGELYLSPVGLSLVTKVAPARILSMMMGVWLATSFSGGFLAGWLGSFWSRMEKPHFFLMIAAISALAGVIIFLCRWPLRGALRE